MAAIRYRPISLGLDKLFKDYNWLMPKPFLQRKTAPMAPSQEIVCLWRKCPAVAAPAIRRFRPSSAAPADGFPPATERWFAPGNAPPASARRDGSPPRSPAPAPRLRGPPVRTG